MFRNSMVVSDMHQNNVPTKRDPFGRLGPDDTETDTEITDFKNPISLQAPVGDYGENRRRDVAKTEKLLGAAGSLDLEKTDGPTGFWGTRSSDATKAFQKQNGLKIDGQINPDGETIRALGKLTGQPIKSRESNNTGKLVLGVWPDGKGPSQKPVSSSVPPGKGFSDSVADDESAADDNAKHIRNDHDDALQHLVEGGLEPEAAKRFLDLIDWDRTNEESRNGFIDAMRWLSGRINKLERKRKDSISYMGGIRG